jgi:hypothetical protein
MTVSELIEELRTMPPDATVMVWSRMDDPQHRRLDRVELSTTKSDPTAEIVVLSQLVQRRGWFYHVYPLEGLVGRRSIRDVLVSPKSALRSQQERSTRPESWTICDECFVSAGPVRAVSGCDLMCVRLWVRQAARASRRLHSCG